MSRKNTLLGFAIAAFLLSLASGAQAGAVLDGIKSAGVLSCGVNTDQDDYSKADRHGNVAALGADFCKAVAVAILGPDAKVKVTGFPDEPTGLRAVRAGEVALLAGVTPMIESTSGLSFGPVLFYDGQGFLVAKSAGFANLSDLKGKQVCFVSGTEADEVLQREFAARDIHHAPHPFQERGEMELALVTNHCQAITGDVSELAGFRRLFRDKANDFVILPQTIAQDPLVSVYRPGDAEFAAIVFWTQTALIQAEEDGVTSANAESLKKSKDPKIARLLGTIPGTGKALGLADDWVAAAIKTVGNYGEIFDRDVGKDSPLKLDRGLNALWSKGGLMYAYPMW